MRWRKRTWIWSWWAREFLYNTDSCAQPNMSNFAIFIHPFQIPSQRGVWLFTIPWYLLTPVVLASRRECEGCRHYRWPNPQSSAIWCGKTTPSWWQIHELEHCGVHSPSPNNTLAVQNEDISMGDGDGGQGLKAELEQLLKVIFFMLHAPSLTKFPGRLCLSKWTRSRFQYPPNCAQNKVGILWCLPCFAANYCFQKTWYIISAILQDPKALAGSFIKSACKMVHEVCSYLHVISMCSQMLIYTHSVKSRKEKPFWTRIQSHKLALSSPFLTSSIQYSYINNSSVIP